MSEKIHGTVWQKYGGTWVKRTSNKKKHTNGEKELFGRHEVSCPYHSWRSPEFAVALCHLYTDDQCWKRGACRQKNAVFHNGKVQSFVGSAPQLLKIATQPTLIKASLRFGKQITPHDGLRTSKGKEACRDSSKRWNCGIKCRRNECENTFHV